MTENTENTEIIETPELDKSNPEAVLDAITSGPIVCGYDLFNNPIEVVPVTLASYSLLEKINSLLLFPEYTQLKVNPSIISSIEENLNVANYITSLYIVTHNPSFILNEVKRLVEVDAQAKSPVLNHSSLDTYMFSDYVYILANKWAETLPPDVPNKIVDAFNTQLNVVMGVSIKDDSSSSDLKKKHKSGNGLVTDLLHFAVTELRLNPFDALYVVPLAHIILLRTETFFQNGGKGMTLFEIEDINEDIVK